MGGDVGKTFKRAWLAAHTLGTSEIHTGGGTYGDETLADSIFPKAINDKMLDDRTAARATTDAGKQAEKDAIEARKGLAPDLTDETLAAARKVQTSSESRKSGRASSFLVKAPTSYTPNLNKSKLLGI